MKKGFIITIDGPAGAGKTTIARALAQKLDIPLLESGALYRYLTWRLINEQKELNDFSSDQELRNYLKEKFKEIVVTLSKEGTFLSYNNKTLKEELRTKEVEELVSEVSANKIVREEITKFLRELVKEMKVVTEGRDMGSVVFPHADLKIYLTAELEERAKRRLKDVSDRDFEEIKRNLEKRDLKDSTRSEAPLVIPEGAVIIDTTHMSIEEVLSKIEGLIKEKL